MRKRYIVLALYIIFLMLPIYWLLNMSLKTNAEITGSFTLFPTNLTFQNYRTILTDPSWYMASRSSSHFVVFITEVSMRPSSTATITAALRALPRCEAPRQLAYRITPQPTDPGLGAEALSSPPEKYRSAPPWTFRSVD